MEHIVIIGNGIAGVTAARHIRKLSANKKITIVSSETTYFYARTALMYVYMGHIKFEQTQPYENHFWAENNIHLVHDYVRHVDSEHKVLRLASDAKLHYDTLVIASGSKPNKFGWPGQDLEGVMGMYHKQDLDNLENLTLRCRQAVIVGGGLIGIEMAEMLRSRNIEVTFLVREESFWNAVLPTEESEMINRHITEHKIDLRLKTGLKEIIANEDGCVKAVMTDGGEIIDCQIVGLTVGVSPNIEFLKDSGIELGRGVKVNRYLETNIVNVYAIGDCAEQRIPIGERKPIEAIWYTGRMMGEVVARTICGLATIYNPSHWFNSAKFLDLEYQTYGWVWPKRRPGEHHFFWLHASGNKSIRIAFDLATRRFLGINSIGIRMRHSFFDQALTNQLSVDEVIENLQAANFDPEFYGHHEQEIYKAFKSTVQPRTV
ncbi:MAG: FAD/NAD(P)-binding oxidoreductase [Saprospiraceae bacterium]|mgnify:CR=1 FL=1|nr:FAD/NAD(P)-binding oxidoreductase [Saprospiraceae bacterium]